LGYPKALTSVLKIGLSI